MFNIISNTQAVSFAEISKETKFLRPEEERTI